MSQDIYVAIATYAPEDDIAPLVALGITAELAEGALENLIEDSENPEGWIAGGAELHGVAQPRIEELPFWTEFTDEQRAELIEIQSEELRDCTADVAREMLEVLDEESLRAMLDVSEDDASSDDA